MAQHLDALAPPDGSPCSPEPGTNNVDERTPPPGTRNVRPEDLSPEELAAELAPLQTAVSGTIRRALQESAEKPARMLKLELERQQTEQRDQLQRSIEESIEAPRRMLREMIERQQARKPMTEALRRADHEFRALLRQARSAHVAQRCRWQPARSSRAPRSRRIRTSRSETWIARPTTTS